MENIRSFNSMFAFTSIGGNIDKTKNDGKAPPVFVLNGENYHQIGSLLPKPGHQPKFAQLYIYDTDNELKNRMDAVRYILFVTCCILILSYAAKDNVNRYKYVWCYFVGWKMTKTQWSRKSLKK